MKTLARIVLASSALLSTAALAQDADVQMPNVQMNIQVDGDADMPSARIQVQGTNTGGEQGMDMRVNGGPGSVRMEVQVSGDAAQPAPARREVVREVVREERVIVERRGPDVFRDCGTHPRDPGCVMQRNGQLPMDATTFRGVMQALKGTDNELVREDMAAKMLKRNYLTAQQFGLILDLFENELSKLDVARGAASHVVNPQHALGFASKWNNSLSGEEFVELMSGQ